MKIAYFTDLYLPMMGGLQVSVQEFADRLSDKHKVRVYAPAYGLGEKLFSDKFEVERYKSVPMTTYKGFELPVPNVVRLYKSVVTFRPEVIHIHSPGPLGLMGLLMARRLKIPTAGTYHAFLNEFGDYISLGVILRKWGREVVGRLKEKGLVGGWLASMERVGEEAGQRDGGEDRVFKRAVWFLVNKFYNYCGVVVVPSPAVMREITARGVKKPVVVISNGIDLRKFSAKKKYGLGFRVVHVGRLGYEKKVDVVIRAFELVVKKVPKARLVIAGDGPARGDLERLTLDLGLTGRVEFLGMVPRDRVARLYRSGDVFVTASAMETQGIVILEAMACGVPVVGVDKYAVPDMVKPGVTGYLAPPGDFEKLAEGVERVLGSKRRAESLGRAARKAAEKEDVEGSIKKMEKVYADLVKGGV